MKKIKYLAIIFIIGFAMKSNTVFAQAQFIGTWKNQTGNQIFYVTFYFERTRIRGNYRKVIVDSNGNEIQEVYRSNKFITGTTIEWPSCLLLSFDSANNEIGGSITDNTINPSNILGISRKDGILNFKILPTCSGCPLTGEWKIKLAQGLQIEGAPDFNIPKNIILTKM